MNIFASNTTADSEWTTEDYPIESIDFRYYPIHLIVYSFVFLLGVPGNCLILRVYSTKTCKTSTDFLIRALAWADLAVCLLEMPVIIEMSLILAAKNWWDSFPLWLIVVQDVIVALSDVAIFSSFSITAVIAVERYDCVCRPQKRMFNPRRSKIAVLVAVLFAIAITAGGLVLCICVDTSIAAPYSLEVYRDIEAKAQAVLVVIALVTIAASYGKVYATIRKHVQVGHAQAPTARDELRPSDLTVERQCICSSTRPTPLHRNNSLNTRESFVDEAVTRFVTSPSSSPTTHENYHQKKRNDYRTGGHVVPVAHQDSSGPSQPHVIPEPKAETAPRDNIASRRQGCQAPGHAPQRVGAAKLQRKTTRMLVITSLVFLLAWLPYLICVVKFHASPDADEFKEVIENISILFLINSVLNPFIYGIANRRFRKDCKEVIRNIKCCKCW